MINQTYLVLEKSSFFSERGKKQLYKVVFQVIDAEKQPTKHIHTLFLSPQNFDRFESKKEYEITCGLNNFIFDIREAS